MPEKFASCEHDHDCGEHDCGVLWRLNQHIDTPKVRALNEAVPGSCKELFRDWDDRLDFSKCCSSEEDDPELIIHVPFTSDVKLKSICVIGGTDGSSPSKLKVFVNREDIDFTNVSDTPAVQEWELAENINGNLEYQTRFTKFQSVSTLTMYFPESFSGDSTMLHFIGFKGEHTGYERDKVCSFVYEAKPLPEDHKTEADKSFMKSIL
mmetsp:Transcript_10220/g.25926  ORF Transcript_10220/g.25926 Transcript_10220/m.25926 type:complete len:208 (-) Transcript_10220:197-820(-)|eukprot:CAMPEP_0198234598 /NCGR_PEP_ID=MMETSP1446-20131203/585_1 /TAXON_ID=1461542 ORGANISM="Unidentified sp, Strain CCMP2111" /NCGR_SAMPLE_ID=MMETSP1446 /ASSEMBLY_ACC=CAM_ASM_001112 /LENGTH=207 /DNA_ID=CAMNT_0043915403 /DNA_START=9 /DNA_END=632 /DNA_ORIENTATION=+